MIIVDDILVSEEIFEKQFVCNLSKCKGACCVAGEAGAPLKKGEIETLKLEFENYKPYLTSEGIGAILRDGYSSYDAEDKDDKTMLIDGGPCAYINYDEKGIAICGIEKAYFDGKTTFRKPISCHLYPIRESGIGKITAVNYEEWEICSDACALGEELKVPVFKFLKEPLIRAYGEDFFEAIDQYYMETKVNSKDKT
jgi:Protein of unknown function (DUF3109)